MDPSQPPAYWCPLGEGRLVRNDSNGVHYTCDVCHGYAISIWLLGELLVEGAGAAMWRSSEGAPTHGVPCPSCRQPMAEVAVSAAVVPEPGPPLEICRACELVWIGHAASVLLPVLPVLDETGAAAPGPTHCPNCGAVYLDTDGGRCRYCRAEIEAAHVGAAAPEVAREVADAHLKAMLPDPHDDWVGDYIEREGKR